ncbi:MAG: hypothetical protein LBS63_05835 [Prevotellaceae bacterium]|jgi:hypothetical protein|nr:hypothetical protein [Prevotellaceae bacterium]
MKTPLRYAMTMLMAAAVFTANASEPTRPTDSVVQGKPAAEFYLLALERSAKKYNGERVLFGKEVAYEYGISDATYAVLEVFIDSLNARLSRPRAGFFEQDAMVTPLSPGQLKKMLPLAPPEEVEKGLWVLYDGELYKKVDTRGYRQPVK